MVGTVSIVRAILIGSVLATLSLPAAVLSEPLPVADPATRSRAPDRPIDVSADTVRDAARASAQASNEGVIDRDRAVQPKTFREIAPTCSKLLAITEIVAATAICATGHCGNAGSALDQSSPAQATPRPRTHASSCASQGVKLW